MVDDERTEPYVSDLSGGEDAPPMPELFGVDDPPTRAEEQPEDAAIDGDDDLGPVR